MERPMISIVGSMLPVKVRFVTIPFLSSCLAYLTDLTTSTDIGNMAVSGYEDCFYQCGLNAKCQGFAYLRNIQRCYLKDFSNGTQSQPVNNNNIDMGMMTGALQYADECQTLSVHGGYQAGNDASRRYSVACQNDMNGSGDIGNVAGKSLKECMGSCDSTANCVAVTFDISGQRCYFKSIKARDLNVMSRSGFNIAYLSSLTNQPTTTKSQRGS